MNRRIYVAGSSQELDLVDGYMRRLRDAGFEITYDWVAEIRKAGKANYGLTEKERFDAASLDMVAVKKADIVWLLIPRTPSSGSWVEFGIVLGLNRWHARLLTHVSGVFEKSIFTALADYRHPDHQTAFAAIVKARSMSEDDGGHPFEPRTYTEAEIEAAAERAASAYKDLMQSNRADWRRVARAVLGVK